MIECAYGSNNYLDAFLFYIILLCNSSINLFVKDNLMNWREVLMNPYDYINNFIKFGTKGGYKPGLKRIDAMLDAFDHPERKLKIIHVAGSNGKGSTIAFLKSIYREAGYKVGVYTSPHLLDFNERLEINGEKITTEYLSELIELLKPVVDRIGDSVLGEPSFFEFVTTLAFLYFYQQQVDLLIFEVGLGGRLDATNIIQKPLISVITGISLEHTSILGDTIEEIAREKAGIIKKGIPVLTSIKDKKALGEVEKIAFKMNSSIENINEKYRYCCKESTLEGQQFSLKYQHSSFKEAVIKENKKLVKSVDKREIDLEDNYKITLLGEYQLSNSVLAIEIVRELLSQFDVREKDIKRGLMKAYIPGRLEVMNKKPLILLDGAHNIEGIKMFVSFLQKLLNNSKDNERSEKKGKIYIIFAALGDKDIWRMLEIISQLKNIELIISENKDKRAMKAEKIKEKAESLNIDNRIVKPLKKAFKLIDKESMFNDTVCIIGSLYNVAEAKEYWSFR